MSADSTKKPNPKNISKEQLIAAAKRKRECKAIASGIVEALLQTSTKSEDFLKMIKYISICHYEDVVEERHILKLCGYPLCGNENAGVPTKKYQISTVVNKVYDITYRKMFCCTKCYKASEYIKSQMLTSPLWLRDQEEIPEFVLLSDV